MKRVTVTCDECKEVIVARSRDHWSLDDVGPWASQRMSDTHYDFCTDACLMAYFTKRKERMGTHPDPKELQKANR